LRRAAGYVDRILKGEKPAAPSRAGSDLVRACHQYQYQDPKALGFQIPDKLLAIADEFDRMIKRREFALPLELKVVIGKLLDGEQEIPSEAVVTHYYDGTLRIEYISAINEKQLAPEPLVAALAAFASAARAPRSILS
jgi:hypothetical protein